MVELTQNRFCVTRPKSSWQVNREVNQNSTVLGSFQLSRHPAHITHKVLQLLLLLAFSPSISIFLSTGYHTMKDTSIHSLLDPNGDCPYPPNEPTSSRDHDAPENIVLPDFQTVRQAALDYNEREEADLSSFLHPPRQPADPPQERLPPVAQPPQTVNTNLGQNPTNHTEKTRKRVRKNQSQSSNTKKRPSHDTDTQTRQNTSLQAPISPGINPFLNLPPNIPERIGSPVILPHMVNAHTLQNQPMLNPTLSTPPVSRTYGLYFTGDPNPARARLKASAAKKRLDGLMSDGLAQEAAQRGRREGQ